MNGNLSLKDSLELLSQNFNFLYSCTILEDQLLVNINNYVISIFCEKNQPHNRPHFHIFKQNKKICSIDIETGEKLNGEIQHKCIEKVIENFRLNNIKNLLLLWQNIDNKDIKFIDNGKNKKNINLKINSRYK